MMDHERAWLRIGLYNEPVRHSSNGLLSVAASVRFVQRENLPAALRLTRFELGIQDAVSSFRTG